MISSPWPLPDLSYQRQASRRLWASLNSKTVLLSRMDLLFSTRIPTAILSSAWDKQPSEALGHGSESMETLQKLVSVKNRGSWEGTRRKWGKQRTYLLQGIGMGLDSSTSRKIKAQPSWGSWQFKDSYLSWVRGAWKRACVPWSGLAEC